MDLKVAFLKGAFVTIEENARPFNTWIFSAKIPNFLLYFPWHKKLIRRRLFDKLGKLDFGLLLLVVECYCFHHDNDSLLF